MDRILFGDNQFFGVNHMSEDKARAQAMQFRDTSAIKRVLDDVYDSGINVFMCTTHDRIGEIVEIVRANPERYRRFKFYPCMPYAHKYANSVGEVGAIETLRRFAPGGMIERSPTATIRSPSTSTTPGVRGESLRPSIRRSATSAVAASAT